jgi:hypothetical protein
MAHLFLNVGEVRNLMTDITFILFPSSPAESLFHVSLSFGHRSTNQNGAFTTNKYADHGPLGSHFTSKMETVRISETSGIEPKCIRCQHAEAGSTILVTATYFADPLIKSTVNILLLHIESFLRPGHQHMEIWDGRFGLTM